MQVSRLCLGGMLFGDDLDEAASISLIHQAIDSGINFLDTADIYNRGVSETFIGKALASDGHRRKVFLATKVFGRMDDQDPNAWGSHRSHIIQGCEDSLQRLGTDHIDLYQLHQPHPDVPIDETLRALDDLVCSGKVHYIGTSNFGAWQFVEALWASKELHLNRFVTEQPPYNLLDRRIERELLPMCHTYGVATLPWAPLAGGLLSGKYRLGQTRPAGARYEHGARDSRDNDTALAAIEKYLSFCEMRGVVPAQFALAWCLAQPGVTSPIIGPRTPQQLDDYLAALSLTVTAEDAAKIDSIFPPGTHVSRYGPETYRMTARW